MSESRSSGEIAVRDFSRRLVGAKYLGYVVALAGLFVFCAVSFVVRGTSRRDPSVTVSMELSRLSTNECAILVTISNRGKRDLIISRDDLPWNFASEFVTVVLIEEDHFMRQPILRTPQIYDRGVSLPMAIKPGRASSREVYLDRYYHKLCEVLSHRDVTMLWVYLPPAIPGYKVEPIEGQLRIPCIRWPVGNQ